MCMNKEDLYLLYAADCQQMACITRNEHERLTWLDMAQSWLEFMRTQMEAFAKQANSLSEAYIKAASGQTNKPRP